MKIGTPSRPSSGGDPCAIALTMRFALCCTQYPICKPANHKQRNISLSDVIDRDPFRSSQRLLSPEEIFKALFEEGEEGIFIVDPQQCFVDANPQFISISGYSKKELLHMRRYELISKNDRDKLVELAEHSIRRKNGDALIVEVISRSLPDGHLVGIVRDIAGRRRAENELLLSNFRLSRAESSIFTQSPCTIAKRMSFSGSVAKRGLGAVVNDLNDAVGSILRMLPRLIGEHINFAWMPKGGLWTIRIDPSQDRSDSDQSLRERTRCHHRAVFHHQGGRQRLRPRACDGLWNSQAEQRIHQRLQRTRKRFHVQDLPAGEPGDALRLAKEHAEKIRLVITDVVMPGMNGRELAKRLSEINPNITCLFSSGYTANVIAHHGVLEDGVHLLPKPFSVNELATKVRQALDLET